MTPAVLAGVDGSPESTAAAHWAAEEALRRGAPLRLLHAWPWLTDGRASFADPEDRPVAAQRMLAAAAEDVQTRYPDLTVHTDVVLDAAVDGMVAAAQDAALLVLGSRGLGGFTGLLLGSVSMAVAGRASVPVVVVRPTEPTGEPAA
ncbi:universal stress protein, partial [Kitasatospora putterlickiae]